MRPIRSVSVADGSLLLQLERLVFSSAAAGADTSMRENRCTTPVRLGSPDLLSFVGWVSDPPSARETNPKSQAPNPKQIRNPKLKIRNEIPTRCLAPAPLVIRTSSFGHCLEFGAWDLGFRSPVGRFSKTARTGRGVVWWSPFSLRSVAVMICGSGCTTLVRLGSPDLLGEEAHRERASRQNKAKKKRIDTTQRVSRGGAGAPPYFCGGYSRFMCRIG